MAMPVNQSAVAKTKEFVSGNKLYVKADAVVGVEGLIK